MEEWEDNKNIELSLKWNNFTENMVSSLESSLGNQDFVDMTLVCEGGSIKAHRLILSACSFFFRRILQDNVCPHPVIILKGITLTELETLLMYMYNGEARTNEHDFPRLLEAAQFLEIRGLTSAESSQQILGPVNKIEHFNICNITNNLKEPNNYSTSRRQSRPVPSLEPVIHDVRTISHAVPPRSNNVIEEDSSHNLEVNIKQEIEEENPFEDEMSAPVDFIQSLPVAQTQFSENTTSCLSENELSVQENLMQEQRKFAFYEPRPCPKCKRVYRDAATLRTHTSIMHEVLPQKITCSCGMLFNTKYEMYTHRKKGHKR